MNIKSIEQTDAAFVLVTVMILAALGGILATALLYGTGSQITRASREIRYEKAFFIAEAGVERAKAELRSAGATSFSATINFGGGESKYQTITTTTTNVTIWSTGTYENASRVLEVKVLIDPGHYPPPNTDGALGVYGTGAYIKVAGNATIDGHDYSLPENFDCNGGNCSGTLSTNTAEPGVFSSVTGTVTDTQGSGDIDGHPATTNGTSQFSTNYWHDQADIWSPQATITLSGTYGSGVDWGTRDNPQITLVTGDLVVTGNPDGAGVLIVMDGVDITLSGNLHYEGIVILLGNNVFHATGTVRIFGSMVLAGSGMNVTSEQGTPSILYSSAALANLQNLEMNPRAFSVLSWREVR